MKKSVLTLLSLISVFYLYSQPNEFTWRASSDTNYISPAKNQGELSLCKIFAAVAAVEAMSHIYYNKPFPVQTKRNFFIPFARVSASFFYL